MNYVDYKRTLCVNITTAHETTYLSTLGDIAFMAAASKLWNILPLNPGNISNFLMYLGRSYDVSFYTGFFID